MNIKNLVRKNILELQPYISFRDANTFQNPIFLDANESPFGKYNRYPDSTHKELRKQISNFKNIEANKIAIGNGSDELIELIIKIFCEPEKDTILMTDPSFPMYGFYSTINGNKVETLKLNQNFEINKADFLKFSKNNTTKIFFLCSPNNPTGNSIDDLEFFIKNYNGIIVIDEAYIEFSKQESAIALLNQFPNLIVLQTFSKAWGLAGVRVGTAYASEEIINLIYAIKAPYNVNALSQKMVLEKLNNTDEFKLNLAQILSERSWLELELKKIKEIKKVYPTDANFFLVECIDAKLVIQKLLENEILTSIRHPKIPNCIRINVGSTEENRKLIAILKKI